MSVTQVGRVCLPLNPLLYLHGAQRKARIAGHCQNRVRVSCIHHDGIARQPSVGQFTC